MNRRWYLLGFAILVASAIFQQPLLLVIGLLILFVMTTTDIWEQYCLRNLNYRRSFSEQRVLFGEEITLSISVENAKILPLPWLEVEDTIPRVLDITGQRLRINMLGDTSYLDNIFSMRWYERVTRTYTVRCRARGVHKFGPATLRSGDVFGFISREEVTQDLDYLLVYPLVVPLTRFGLPARHPFGERRAPRRLVEDPSRVIGVRDYVYGDSLRRVHWKATARTMQMQSKVYEATTTYTLITFLNVVAPFDTLYGMQPEIQELAICATASISDWALNEGYSVGLYANTLMFMPEVMGSLPIPPAFQSNDTPASSPASSIPESIAHQIKRRRIHLPPSSNENQRQRIMEMLARIQPYFGSSIEDVIQAERNRLPAGATVVVVTSTLSEKLLDTLVRVRQAGHAVAVLFVNDAPPPMRLAGISVYHIGGEESWNSLVSTCGDSTIPSAEGDTSIAGGKAPAGLRL